MICGPLRRALAQLVYETTDTDFADRALQALREAHILLLIAALVAISAALAWNT